MELPYFRYCKSNSLLLIRYAFFIITVPLNLLLTDVLNVVVISYVAEPLLRYFEGQEELLLFLNKTVTYGTPSRKLKGCHDILLWKSNGVTCF